MMPSSEQREQFQVPTTGMRGGLGRTLLTAFLVLAIVPLSTVSWYATRRERRDIQREVTAKLSSVATMMEGQVQQWMRSRVRALRVLASVPATRESVSALTSGDGEPRPSQDTLQTQFDALLEEDQAYRRLAFVDGEGRVLASTGTEQPGLDVAASWLGEEGGVHIRSLDPSDENSVIVTQPVFSVSGQRLGVLVGGLDPGVLAQQLRAPNALGDGGEVYLVHPNGTALPQTKAVDSVGIGAALSGQRREGLYENYAGVPVIGVYRWLPDLQLALVAEQPEQEALAVTDNMTAAIVGASLVVALVTAIIAAVVTRQITRPVVRLTESALNIAQGDLAQQVPVTSRDEIGILAYVFNRMAAELKSLYDDLEAKVAQRTAMLQKANYQIQRRAIQLAATVEVSQAVTSILEPAELLERLVQLVHDRFGYSYVGVYLLGDGADNGHRCLKLREGTGAGDAVEAIKAWPVMLGGAPAESPPSAEAEASASTWAARAIRQAALSGEPSVVSWNADRAEQLFSSRYIRAEAALPLKMGQETIGVLDILDTESDALDEDAISVLQNVANQITIALENARINKKEKETARRLRETESFRSRFLAHMSHELREPLTNIIGFSRLMLKGLDGPVNECQREDLHIIHANSQHLLGLINDLLDVSQIEAGMMELHFRTFDLSDTIESVMATTSALVRDSDVELRREIEDLPLVEADVTRVRQVLLKLLTNAAKFTDHGAITVRAWPEDHKVLVAVSDTGKGISVEDQKSVFKQFEQGRLEGGRRPNGAGLGLALSKEFVEMHGGEIWVDSTVGEGTTFTFSLPLEPKPKRRSGGEMVPWKGGDE